MALDWNEELVPETINPWCLSPPNSAVQTGGDWYRLLITASLGVRAVHGANTSPACEVLCKARLTRESEGNYGILSWDDTVKAPGVLGDDISDQFYLHPLYKGNITASGSILAYESGLWEPSVRRRARSSALLAAGLVVHGKTNVEACDLVSRLTGEPIDIQAVDSAIIPASHLKREMVLVAKASHRVFGRGTIQAGITWHDEKLLNRSGASNMAFDWGRITAIARYIGEANIQNCPSFRYLAKVRGIPYSVVRNSWAYVSEADYHLPRGIFRNVPTIDIRRFGIPSLIGSFVGHEHEVMLALNRGSKYLSVIPENEAFGAYLKLHRDARERKGKRRGKGVPSTYTAREVRIVEHTLSEDDLSSMIESGVIVRDAFLMAIASQRQADPKLDTLMQRVASVEMEGAPDYTSVDQATQRIYDRQTWLLARSIAEGSMVVETDDDEDARYRIVEKLTARLAEMKSEIVGYKSHIETRLYLTTSRMVELRVQTINNARKSSADCSFVTYSQRSMASEHLRSAAQALGGIAHDYDDKLQELRDQVAKRFEKWYEEIISDTSVVVRENLAYFAFIGTFLSDLVPSLCYQRESGYIEGTLPRKSYVYQGVVRTSSDYNFVPPRLKRLTYAHALNMAEEFDQTGIIPFSVTGAVVKVLKIADQVVGDLMVGKVWYPEPDMYYEAREEYAEPLSPGYDDSMLKEAEDVYTMTQILAQMEADRKTTQLTGYEACLNTYLSLEEGNKIARANGYPSLKAAFDMLGKEAYYVETSDFVTKARVEIALEAARRKPDVAEAQAKRKRKFGSVL